MENNSKYSSAKIFTLMAVAVIFFASASLQKAFAQDEAAGAEGVFADGSEFVYPDLTTCAALKNPNAYNDDKLVKFIRVGKDGWLFRSADFRTEFTMPKKTMAYMKRVNKALKAKGVDLYLVLQPPRAMLESKFIDEDDKEENYSAYKAVSGYKALIQEFEKNGIQAVDLSEPPSDFEYFLKGDLHWSYKGAEWTAKQLANKIKSHSNLSDVKKTEFTSEIVQWLGNEDGLFEKFVEKACNLKWPPEKRPTWATTSVAAEASEDALFAEVTYPAIAVVGTSNTGNDQDFNFVGSIKKSLSMDVRNHGVSAAGFSGASVAFYSSDEFHEHMPKVMVWEFLSHHDFNDYDGFRQMVPAIEGACEEEEALVTTTLKFPVHQPVTSVAGALIGPLAPEAKKQVQYGPFLPNHKGKKISQMGEFILFDNLESKKIDPKSRYIYLEVMNPNERILKIGVLYANGDGEEIDVSRPERMENNGQYYLEFNNEFVDPVVMVQIETDKQQGDVKARICNYKNAKQ